MDLYHSLLCEVEKCLELAIQFSDNTLFSLLFALDFVGVAETGSALQTLIYIVHNHSKLCHFEANVNKNCAIVFFVSKVGKVLDRWV